MNADTVRNIAHDLKGPIGNTLMFSDLLRDQLKMLSQQQDGSGHDLSSLEDLAENIHKINNKLITLIDSWSEIYKILQGDIEPDSKQLDIKEVVEELRENNELYLTKKNINCTWSVPQNLTLYSDKDMLMRLLDNLLTVSITNVDYDAEIEIRIEDNSEDGVRFAISDNQMSETGQLYSPYLEDWSLKKFNEEELGNSIIKASGVGLVYSSVAIDTLNGTKGIKEKGEGDADGSAEVWFTLPAT